MSKRHALPLPLVILLCIVYTSLQAQDSDSQYIRIDNFADKFFGCINGDSQDLQSKFSEQGGDMVSASLEEKKFNLYSRKNQFWKRIG